MTASTVTIVPSSSSTTHLWKNILMNVADVTIGKSVVTDSLNRDQLIQTTPGIAQLRDPLWVLENKKMSGMGVEPETDF
jgi:hypothetical protein